MTITEAAERLHDEAHADDRVPFRHCTHQTCRDLYTAIYDA